jgi:hypothetical protein
VLGVDELCDVGREQLAPPAVDALGELEVMPRTPSRDAHGASGGESEDPGDLHETGRA